MPNALAHRIGAAAVVGVAIHQSEAAEGNITYKPVVGAGLAASFGTLPDLLEPAFHPNHRQFFHSLGMLGLVGYGLYRLNKWEPETPLEEGVRFVSMVAAGAYLVHLLMDAGTPKSLPILGR